MTTGNPKFFIDADPAFCRIPHPNKRSGKSLPELLESLEFTSLGWDSQKRIYLPATEKFPEASYILEEEVSPRVKRARIAIAGERRNRGQKGTRPFDQEIDAFTREFLLEQARARIEKKMLPSVNIVSCTYHGTRALPMTVVCESVTGHRSFTGSYVTLELWSKSKGDAMLLKYLRTVTGSGRAPLKLVWTLEELIEQAHPEFPWHQNYSRSFMA